MHLNARLPASLLAALAALSLVGCQARQEPERAASGPRPPINTVSSPSDQALAVAFAQNAVQAMALGGQVAALNNLDQAIGRAQSLQGQPWTTGAAGGGRRAQPALDSNGITALLISAKAKLLQGDKVGASAELAPVTRAVPPGLSETELPLLRASASLSLAQGAFEDGRFDETGIELRAAAAQLQAVARTGEDHAAQAATLARSIAGSLSGSPGLARLQGGQLTAWTAEVNGWLGGPLSGATLVVAMNNSGQA